MVNTILTDDERREVHRKAMESPLFPVDALIQETEAAVLAKLREQEPAEEVRRQALDALNRMQSIADMPDGRHPRDVLRSFIQLSPIYAAPQPAVVPQELIEAVDRVLEEAHCDCPHRLRFDDGQHLSGCPLFDLNVARLEMLAAAPEAPATAVVQKDDWVGQNVVGNPSLMQAMRNHANAAAEAPARPSACRLTECEGRAMCPTCTVLAAPEAPALPSDVREALKVARKALAAMLENRGDYTANRDAARAALARLDALGGGE